jgi:hypothetical protein
MLLDIYWYDEDLDGSNLFDKQFLKLIFLKEKQSDPVSKIMFNGVPGVPINT